MDSLAALLWRIMIMQQNSAKALLNCYRINTSRCILCCYNLELYVPFSAGHFYCVNISYLVDRCNSPAPSRSRQTLEKNVLSWALAWTGSVVFTRQVSPDTQLPYCACARMRTSSFCLAPLCLKIGNLKRNFLLLYTVT